MAFQQPTRQLPQRVARVESQDGGSAVHAPQIRLGPNDSQTWVLFTPGTDAGTTTSYLDSVQDDQITPGRSRISDIGSLGHSALPSEALTESVAEEDAELDSLDSHLPEFRTLPNPYHQNEIPHTEPVLPGHDGLGSFRFEALGTSAEAQERMYSFERYNPQRVNHGNENFELGQLEMETEEKQEVEKNRRIEAWRLEQSQLLLEDIRQETRRRRQSEASFRKPRQESGAAQEAAGRTVADEEAADINLAGTDWHDQDGPTSSGPSGDSWSQIARKVICDLMGIDTKVLAILFGEALPEDGMVPSTPKTSAADLSTPAFRAVVSESSDDSAWQLHMLERIARELGTLVHQMSTHPHPGAFSTYSRMQDMPLPYAGLPAIPEAPADVSEAAQKMDNSVPTMPQFQPTAGMLGARHSEPPTPSAPSATNVNPMDAPHTFTQQEWEQDLDIRLVFRYLRSRFTSSRPSSPPFSSGTSHLATSSTSDAAAKAARVRQHHPLVSSHAHPHGYHRSRPVERRTFKATVPPSPVVIRHAPGSCASQSTRRSARRSSISSRPSSRHYWDIGGSIGTGSVIASTGPMGSWGEV